jgi:5-methylcytosine-specific restriction endonuclease McrA
MALIEVLIMSYDDYTRTWIFDRTDGDCHICGDRLCYSNYARFGSRGAWEVEHSVPLSCGGTNHLNNLFAAHIGCNRSKRACSTRVARAQYGRSRAPYRREKKQQIIRDNTITGGFIGGALGAAGGPWGSAVGAYIGGRIGRGLNPND